ncbi:MAG: hypothetical protein OXT67_03900, partial [Zetaproteobacteria bacterium]|nr:hypothetical protein [Zetaproteobacteria bacterium]
MTQISVHPKLQRHLVMFVTSRIDRWIEIQQTLSALNMQTTFCNSIYEAEIIARQDLPHLIISEANLSDGNVFELYKRLTTHTTLAKIPVAVYLTQSSKAEVSKLLTQGFTHIFPP